MINILLNKIKNIKLLITDVDGVLTDGGLYYTIEGLVMKRFQVKDGMAVHLLREKGIEVAIVSGDASDIGIIRGQRLGIELLYKNIQDKKQTLTEICQLKNLTFDEIAYIGDDVNDIEAIKSVAVSSAPADAVNEVLELVDYRCQKKGGEGAFREFADFLLSSI